MNQLWCVRALVLPLNLGLLGLGLLSLGGCDTKPISSGNSRVVQPRLDETEILQQDDLILGLDLLHQVYEPSRFYRDQRRPPNAMPEADRLALYHLNQWLARETQHATAWKPTALLQFVPKSLAAIQPLQELDRSRLTYDDIRFLHGRIWQRDLGRRITAQPLVEPWQTWLKGHIDPADQERSQQLAAAIQLFDWTIRNVQLEPFPPAEKTAAVGTATGKESDALPPQRGVPGPGYQRYPYETLLYGRGDALERARVFIELCRQQGIESVMLAVNQENAAPRPWAVAVMIGSELYLFDAELGLPLPVEQGRGVVTLAQLVKQPELLEQLNLSAKQTYWVKADDLTQLRPLISASPEELSKRMWLLDREAKGTRQLHLFVDADALAARIARAPPLSAAKVALWRVPFECSLYVSLGLGLRLNLDQEFMLQYDKETAQLRNPYGPIRQGRQLQLQGTFDTPEAALVKRRQRERDKTVDPNFHDGGAIELFLMARPEGRAIEDFGRSDFWQQAQASLPNNPQERQKQLTLLTERIQRIRDDVTFWLGLIQYEKGDYENAVKWLQLSQADDSSERPWAAGVRYNLARSHESLGQVETAIELLESDDSPQKYGNRLRAKWLAAGIESRSESPLPGN